jgi:ABC-type transport system involved in multi-copper enzyme maturation permease subunit
MLWHIVKREVYDNMLSLRFALTIALMLILMIVNAIVHLGEYEERIGEYRRHVSESLEEMRSRTDQFHNLVLHGPGKLYKKPSPLAFCAGGEEAFLSGYAEGRRGSDDYGWRDSRAHEIWRLFYPQSRSNLRDVMPDFIKIDWAFLIAVVLSFIGILFTFDSISGERERGTLRLALANSVPRDTVLLGKFIGSFVSIAMPFLMAVLLNLLLLSISGGIQLGTGEWGRLGIVLLIAMVYISIFIALGLLVSSRIHHSSISLVILLLIWVVSVVLIPSTMGSMVRGLKPTMTRDEYLSRRLQLRYNLFAQYGGRSGGRWGGPLFEEPLTREIPPTKAVSTWSQLLIKEAQAHEMLNEEHLNAQISQAKLARSITRASPAAIAQYAVESLAGTGLSRHLHFLEQVRRYASGFRQFLIQVDLADPESPHAIGVREGASEKLVNYDAIPKFEDQISFSGDLSAAITDITILFLFFAALFAGAFLSFLRVDIR